MQFSWLESLCTFEVNDISSLPTVSFTLFSIALLGGIMHCAFMCGPFVMTQLANRLDSTPQENMTELTRLKGAAMLPYHFGRLTTYMLLGAVFGSLGVGLKSIWQQASGWLMLVSGALIVLSILPNIKWPAFHFEAFQPFKKMVKNLMKNPAGLNGYGLGVLLGFIPCGMLYGALTTAAATGSMVSGATVMGAFALGTMPALFAIALFGSLFADGIKQKIRPLAKSGTALAGLWLGWIGVSTLVNLSN